MGQRLRKMGQRQSQRGTGVDGGPTEYAHRQQEGEGFAAAGHGFVAAR